MEKIITQVENLEDRVRVHYHLKKPDGIPQKEGFRDILHKDVFNLLKEPSLEENSGGPFAYREHWAESFFVEKFNKTLVFHFLEYQETARCREQDFEGGPYLKG